MQQQPQAPVQQSRMTSPTQMPTMHQNPYHPPQNTFVNGNPYGMQSASPHGHLYGYGFKSPSYGTTTPYAVSPLPSPTPYAMAYPMAGHLTSWGAPQIQPQQNLQPRQTTRSEKAHDYGRPRVATGAAHVANPSRLASRSSLDTKQDAENVRLATSAPHHGALFRDLSAPFVALSAEGRLADLQKQNAALKKELEKANAHHSNVQILTAQLAETNAQRDAQAAMQQLQTRALDSELYKLKAKLAATEAAATGQPADASLQRHFEDWHMFDGCLQALKQLDDTSLKAEFHHFADITKKAENSAAEEASTDALDKCRLSKQGLAALFAAKNKTLSDAEVEELMLRIDTNGNGEIDWLEFRALARSNSDLEMFFKGLPLERVLASCFARGAADDSLEAFFSQKHSDVVAGVLKAGYIIEAMIAAHIKKQNEARASQEQAAGGAKYGAELKGATVEKFFEGVTGICGEPHPDVERGMAEEHLQQPDSKEGFSTNNYGVWTTPAIEFGLVIKAMGISTGSASKVWQDFIESEGQGSNNGWLTRGDKVLVTETRRCRQRGGGVPEDLRVLQPIEAFGDFGQDGRLKSFPSFLVCDTDTPLQKKVKRARLTRIEVVAVVLYTGPCFMLYNGMLRGFGFCGEVPASEDVEFGSPEFSQLLGAATVADRMQNAGHKFSSTMHALASAIKKIQGIAEDGQGTRLYRGLGGLDVRPFTTSSGFTETAFMSSTRELSVALEYSGVKQGRVATVLAIELSKLDNGADITDFSQYPGERETVWNTCAFLEYYHGRDEIHVTDHGVVRVLLVKANANTKALTVEELEMRRKNVVGAFFDTIQNDVVREIDRCVHTEAFQKRLKVDEYDNEYFKDAFITSIKSESVSRAKVYKAKPGEWFTSSAHLGKAVIDGLALSTLAKAKYELWLRDEKLSLFLMGQQGAWNYHNYQRSYAKLLALQRQELTEAEEAAARQVEGSDGKAAVMVAGVMGKKADKLNGWYETTVDLQNGKPLFRKLKNPDTWLRFTTDNTWMFSDTSDKDLNNTDGWCVSVEAGKDLPTHVHSWKIEEEEEEAQIKWCIDAAKRLQALALADCISRRFLAGEDELDLADETTSLTPLLHHLSLGDVKVAERLLQARASLEHVPSQDEEGKTPLLWAIKEGYADATLLLLKYKANTEATDKDLRTPLDLAVENEKEEAAAVLRAHGALHSLHFAAKEGMTDEVAARIAAGQDVNARDQSNDMTALHLAAMNGHGGVAEALVKAGCNADIQDTLRMTALHWAARYGHGGVAEALLKGGCKKDMQDRDLCTPLDVAVRDNQEEAAAVLRAHGALHSLHFAAKDGMTDEVAAGIAAGQDVNARDQEYGKTALHYAAYRGHGGVAEVLLKAGCNKDIQMEDGRTALELAAENGHGKVVGMLIGAGMTAGQDVNACLGRERKTMLMYASECGHEESVRALIKKGASLEAVEKEYGRTALHLAAMNGHGGVAEALVKAGCNADIQDTEGKTALELAQNLPSWKSREKGHDEVAAMLKEHMACGGRK